MVITTIAQTFTFNGSTFTNGQFTITSQTLGDTSFTPTYPTSNSAGAYTYASSDTNVATVNSTTGAITIQTIGTTNITVSQAAAGNYTAGSVQGSLAVTYKWVKQGGDIDGEASGDKSGYSVSLSNDGSVVAIGAPNNDRGGGNSGHVRVYKLTGGTWTRQGGDINGASYGDQSGYSVSLSNDGSIVAIGAPTNNGNGSSSGHVLVYKYVNNAWVKQGGDIDGEDSGDNSGISVSISSSGLIVAIGAPNNNNTNGTDAGHVRVYKLIGSTWIKQGGDIDGEAASDKFGTSVNLSADGSIVAVGAPNNNNGNGTDAGHVRVYKLIGSTWTKQGGDIDGEAASDNSGTSVSLSEDGLTVAIGAHNNNGNGTDSGHVRVYKYASASGAWIKQGGDIDGEASGDQSGTSISLSADGSIVAIGAPNNDGSGTNSGHVRVYKLIGNTWVKQDGDIDGEYASDNSGYSVSLSGNGLIVAIGEYDNNDNGTGAGQVRVYKYMLSA